MQTRGRIVGADFSGATDAGHKIWLATGLMDDIGLRITDCIRAQELPDSAASRDAALASLVHWVAQAPDTLFGFDFPFSLPRALMNGQLWVDFVVEFAHRFPTDADFLRDCRALSPGQEVRRQTDRDARTPFAPYNLRVYRQTYYGLRHFLAPLVASQQAVVLPMQPARTDLPWIIEICPASILKRLGLYRPYKGRGEAARQQRDIILTALESMDLVLTSPALRSAALDDSEGDALDALIAALGTWQAAHTPADFTCRDDLDRIEGRVYF